jgi:Fic family protein/DNA-binding XRE family transcriptional regulator
MKKLIKNARIQKGIKTRELAQMLGIDQALVSKFENGSRLPTRTQVKDLSHYLDIPESQLMSQWIKEKFLTEFGHEEYVDDALQLVHEELATYKKFTGISWSQELTVLLNEIDALKSELEKLRSFDSYRIAEALELEYTFESNRIEGNTLTLQETDLVINEGLTIAGKSMREHLEAINHNEAIDYVKDLVLRKVKINEREVLMIHNLILRGIMPENAGKYRSVQVMIKGSAHTPPQPFLVMKKMEEYFEWYSTNKNLLHPVVLAAEMHEKLVTIHPFVDGNGRTSRLIMNLILLSNGYVIANIKGDYSTRMNYYSALEKVQTQNSKEAFLLFIAKVEKECLERYLAILKG